MVGETGVLKLVKPPVEFCGHRMKCCMGLFPIQLYSSCIVCFPPVKNKAVAMSNTDVLYIPATIQPQLEPYGKRKLFISFNANTAALCVCCVV